MEFIYACKVRSTPSSGSSVVQARVVIVHSQISTIHITAYIDYTVYVFVLCGGGTGGELLLDQCTLFAACQWIKFSIPQTRPGGL